MTYSEQIESTRLVEHVELTLTTGDPDYRGTALEVRDENGEELFHVVIDRRGETQFRFFQSAESYRMPLRIIEHIASIAREKLTSVD